MAALTMAAIVAKTQDLPVFSAAATEVMRLTGSGDASAAHVANALSRDPSLSVRVLRLANSAFFGLPRRVTDLKSAVVILGMRSVRNISLAAASYPWLSRSLPGYGLGPRELLAHSFSVALASRLAAQLTRKVEPDTAFTAGLIHDLGKVALSPWVEPKRDAMLFYSKREGISFDETERRVLGFDHGEVGAALADQWNLPPALVDAIRLHHRPPKEEPVPLVDCVHAGAHLIAEIGLSKGADQATYAIDESVLARLGITLSDLVAAAENVIVGSQEYESLFKEMEAA